MRIGAVLLRPPRDLLMCSAEWLVYIQDDVLPPDCNMAQWRITRAAHPTEMQHVLPNAHSPVHTRYMRLACERG